MKKIIVLSLCSFIQYLVLAQLPSNDPHWQLKWEDNFEGNTLNTNRWLKWNYSDHWGEEPQLMLEQNVWVANNKLNILLDNNKAYCPNPPPDTVSGACGDCKPGWHDYTSGCVETKPKYYVKYGYIEARIQAPFKRKNTKGYGLWPAFWTYIGDEDNSLPYPKTNEAEIDIFEMFGHEYKFPNTINTCIHNSRDTKMGMAHTFDNFDYRDWHTYAIEWNPNRIIWYVDGIAIRGLLSHNIVDQVRIILGIGIHEKHLPPTSPHFAEYMYVDYVKVYELKCDKNTPLTINTLADITNYDNRVKKSITINSITIPAGSRICMRANDFIELKPRFEVKAGREMYLDVSPCEMQTVQAPFEED